MKILELTNFSAGICGVWSRVKQESELLTEKNHEVRVFSSNFVKGSNKIAPTEEMLGKIKITRFPATKLGGESFMSWKFEKEALKFKPDLIIAHSYRHLHTTKTLKVINQLRKQGNKVKVFLVTHAPFTEDNSTRTFFGKLAVNFYDRFIGPRKINKFDKVIAITKWEIPYIIKLGCKKEKLTYIPNGIPEEFFKEEIKEFKGQTIVFLGRISPIKDLETLIKAFKIITKKNKTIKLKIIGPVEEPYGTKITKLVEILELNDKSKLVEFVHPIYDLNKKIKALQGADIFVLPSKSEAMPQVLIEAMSLGKVVISSTTQGGKEIIENGKTGFLFEIKNEKQLSDKILWCLNKKNK